eukprot:Ihof_evm1s539 gene=Ihof_evmTU1s539
MQFAYNTTDLKKYPMRVRGSFLRFPRLKTWALLAALVILVRLTFFRSSGNISKGVRVSRVGEPPVVAFAGSDIVLFTDNPKEALDVQGFNSAPYQLGIRFKWTTDSPVVLENSLGSIAHVTGLQSVTPGEYALHLVITNDAGGADDDTVVIHVVDRSFFTWMDDSLVPLKRQLAKRIIVTLPQSDTNVTALDDKLHGKLGITSYLWVKLSGSPMAGECTARGQVGECRGLVEGVYNYFVIGEGPETVFKIPITISVYPAKLRIYDHASMYTKNQALLPVYIKAEPVVPNCEVDTKFTQPKVNETLLLAYLRARAVNNTVVLGFTGDSYLTLARNWLCSVKSILGNTNYLVVAFNQASRDAMIEMERRTGGDDMAVYFDETLLYNKKMNFKPRTANAQRAWKEIMSVKTTVIEAIIRLGYNILVMDADTVLLQNPFSYVWGRSKDCDIQWQADGKDRFLWEDLQARTHFNAGVYFAHSTPLLRELYTRWLEAYQCKKGRREQHALTIVLHNTYRGRWTLHNPEIEPKVVPEDTVKFCYLDSKLFPDGGYFVYHEKYQAIFGDSKQMLLHANNLQQDDVAKKIALQNHKAWFLQEDDLT